MRCEDEKMFYRPPLLEEPCAQTLSGKNEHPEKYGEILVSILETKNLSASFLGLAIHSNWWYTYPSEKYEFVSWDDGIPNIWKVKKNHVPNHLPDMYIYIYT